LQPRPLLPMDIVRLTRRHWLVVLLFGLSGLGGATAVYRHSSASYEAEIMIVPLRGGHGPGSLATLLAGIPLGLEERHSEIDRIERVLRSRSVTDAVIDRFDLIRRYQAGNVENTRRRLWSSCSAAADKEKKVVRLSCEDEEPLVARHMADSFAQRADLGLRQLARSSASEERRFVEARMAIAERALEESSSALRTYQEKHGIVDPIAQASAVVSVTASLQRQLLSHGVRLAYTGGFAADRESSMLRLRQQIAAIDAELRALESGPPSRSQADDPTGSGVDPFPPALLVPALRAELEALVREHKVRLTVGAMLAMRHEALLLQEMRNLSSFVVFDPAALPTRRVRPTFRILPPGFVAGVLLGVLFISRRSWWRTRAVLRR
jgi:tyrosine-protein kinase Etk/Wzc